MNRCAAATVIELFFLLEDGNTVTAGVPLEVEQGPKPWDLDEGGDVSQRIQDEIARRHSGVRHRQPRLVDRRTDHPQEIQIDDARPPTLAPVPTHVLFDAEQSAEQIPRGKLREQTGDGVDEVRLILGT